MTTIAFDKDVAIEQFAKRYARCQGSQINNSALPAGSPMYYYCKHCGTHTETLSEGHWSRPKTVCEACEALAVHGLIPDALEAARKAQEARGSESH